MRNTQTGFFSGLFVIIGHNLVICTEIWSILQRTAEHFCSYCHGEKSIETDEPIVKPLGLRVHFCLLRGSARETEAISALKGESERVHCIAVKSSSTYLKI